MYYYNSNKNAKTVLRKPRQPECWVHMEKLKKQGKVWIKE